MGAHELAPAREVARRAAGERAAREVLAPREALDRQLEGHARDEVERAHALLLRDIGRRLAHAREARHEGLGDVERGRGRGDRVEGVAALAQDLRPGLRGQRMGRGDDAVDRCDARTLAVHGVPPGDGLAMADLNMRAGTAQGPRRGAGLPDARPAR